MSNELPPADLPAWRHTKKHRRAVQEALVNRRQTGHVLRELKAERARQDARWGQQDHPDYTGQPSVDWFEAKAQESRRRAEYHAKNGTLSWDHILQEEWDEAREQMALGNQDHLRTELVQVMAVAAAWIEALDRRAESVPDVRDMTEAEFQQHVEDEARRDAWPSIAVPETVRMMDTTFHGPDDVCSEGQTHTTRCVKVPGLDNPPVYVAADASAFEREEIDTTSDTDAAGREGMRSSVPGRLVQGLGMTEQTRNALADMGYVVEEFPEGSALYDSVVIRPERGKAQAYVSERGGLTAAEFDAKHPAQDEAERAYVQENYPRTGAAGQPVTSYSGGGVRDVTEGKTRLDLLWPLGVPFEAQMLTRVGLWLERGMRKYAERNWELFHTPDALTHALASKARHDGQYACGATNEDHAAAIITNVIFAETIRWKIENGWTPDQEPRLRDLKD